MIYLIKLAMLCEDKEDMTKDTAELILKIGYTSDDRKKSRFSDYIATGHRIRIIKTISGGSSELEHRVQKYFAKYRFPGRSQEWFCVRPEIIDAFNSCETVEDLEKFAVSESNAVIKKSTYSWPKIYEDSEFSDLTKDNVQLNRLKKELYTLCIELTTFPDKLKYLCEKIDSEDLAIFLQVLPMDFKKYYEVLGPERLKANGYRRSELEKEYLDALALSNFDEVRSLVYSKFELNEKYSRETIKKGLQDIFKTAGLNRTATAQSIKEFFKVEEKKFTDTTKNARVSGYLIVSRLD